MKKLINNYALQGFIIGYIIKYALDKYIGTSKNELIATSIGLLPIIGLLLGIYLWKRKKILP